MKKTKTSAAAWPCGTERNQGNAFTTIPKPTDFSRQDRTALYTRRRTAMLDGNPTDGKPTTNLQSLTAQSGGHYSPPILGREASMAGADKNVRMRKAAI